MWWTVSPRRQASTLSERPRSGRTRRDRNCCKPEREWSSDSLFRGSPSPHDSTDKAPVSGRLSLNRRDCEWEMTVGEQDRRAAPTPLLAGRDALTTPRRIRERPRTDPQASRVAGVAPVPVAARGPPSVGRGVAGFAEPPMPGQSARRDAAARRSADTPGHRVQTFAASAPPTDTHRPGTVWRASHPHQPPLTVPRASSRHRVTSPARARRDTP